MHKQILRLAIPNIVTNLTIPLLNLVDLHLMGHLDSEVYIGAVSLGAVIFNFVYWGFAFLRMSISGLSAQTVGSGNEQESALMLSRGLLIAFGGSLLLLLGQVPLLKLSMWMLEGSAEVKTLAADYYYIRIWSAPATIAQMVFFGWFLGMQNAFVPMLVAVVVNVVNIACSYIFVHYLGWDVKGVALASVIAHYLGLTLCIIYAWLKFRSILIKISLKGLLKLKYYGNFLNVSGDIFIRTLCVIVVFTFFTSKSAGMGNSVLAANSALLQFLFFFAYFLDGFAYAAEAIVGRIYGSRDKTAMKQTVNNLFKWGVGFALVFVLLYGLFAENLLSFITNHQSVLNEAMNYYWWVVLIPLVSFTSFIWDGIYIGISASKAMRNTMLVASIGFFFFPFFILYPVVGNHAVWISMNAFMLMRGLLQTIIAPKVVWRKLS